MSAASSDPTFLDRCSPAYRAAVTGRAGTHIHIGAASVGVVRRDRQVSRLLLRLTMGDATALDFTLSPALARKLATELMLRAEPTSVPFSRKSSAAGDGRAAPG